MKAFEYRVRFTTPAFLGNAEQNGQWRTPPFKALLRQWWRVAEVRGGKPDVGKLHSREGTLFGRAADEGTTASQVRLRLDWRGGTAKRDAWKGLPSVAHPEVRHKPGADLYLAYGPVDVGSELKRKSFIPAAAGQGQARTLKVGVPESEAARFDDVARLVHAFGALGSRSRNGWGSLHFDEGALTPQELAAMLDAANRAGREWLRPFSRDWKQALDSDWCHTLGRDETGLLLWRTEAMARWEDVLKTLAEVKVVFRIRFPFKGGSPHTALWSRMTRWPDEEGITTSWNRWISCPT
jgi:CRISPR-associated protein Cmr1